jgi:dethiobiotin synthetase
MVCPDSAGRVNGPIFVCGTDTGVGKTVVASGIASVLAREGYKVGVMKPVATGCVKRGGRLISPDAVFLREAAGVSDRLDYVNPVALGPPLAPWVACSISHRTIAISKIKRAYRYLNRLYPVVIVEGIGGIMVPIKIDFFVLDLIVELGLPMVLVTSPGLGTINHTLLTLAEAGRRGIRTVGLVINYAKPFKRGLAERTNPRVLRRLSGLPVLAQIPFLGDLTPKTLPYRVFRPLAERLFSLTSLS